MAAMNFWSSFLNKKCLLKSELNYKYIFSVNNIHEKLQSQKLFVHYNSCILHSHIITILITLSVNNLKFA